jgi:hypothetical protein
MPGVIQADTHVAESEATWEMIFHFFPSTRENKRGGDWLVR